MSNTLQQQNTTLQSKRLDPSAQPSRPGHRRSVSAGAPLIYSGGGSSLLPSGNICPSGKILKPVLPSRGPNRTDVLGSGTVNYGRGSIMRGGSGTYPVPVAVPTASSPLTVKRALGGSDPEELKRVGNELYRSGNFLEALTLYDRAVAISPGNAACRSNRSAALTALGRLGEAVRECHEAVKLDPAYARAHKRLASLCLRFGQVENSRRHLCLSGIQEDQSEEQKLLLLEKHLNRCADSRKFGDWKRVLRESEAAIAVGADFSPQIVACKAEAYLKLHQLEDAESSLLNIPKLEGCPAAYSQTKFFGMVGEAYVPFVSAQVEMALGRFENAVVAAEKASTLDYSNVEVGRIVNVVRMVARARSRGNDLFSSGKFSEACSAYGEGLKYDNSNYVLYCNRAICWSKLGLWEQSVQDCNQALNIQPNYTKALFRRAASNSKLERWADVIKDYQALKRELPNDNEVAESLRRAQLALEKSRLVVHGTKFGVEVEEISALDKFKAAIASAGVSVVYFKEAPNKLCEEISPFINTLCVRYPSVKFIKVDAEECIAIAKAENIRSVPTFKIYKNGEKVKEMIQPTHELLEESIKRSNSL
ncbi:inactive TPR repeat-containing thioredoxin TTL3-like [Vigna umbellata]|uniref:inactive TPR repeat-containing thioredoxin TTL3-like n=1 Tax=Vigna umbellata TaxID=87088 RepID=UPI001F5FC84F|nr:inactive TPR repeat-containing thioredoxin TTL3-like [Vigna umbellata]XP_047153398.1 inactive TPR repeat-containing thioredoxin TTL3-like [Vigna umbellata]